MPRGGADRGRGNRPSTPPPRQDGHAGDGERASGGGGDAADYRRRPPKNFRNYNRSGGGRGSRFYGKSRNYNNENDRRNFKKPKFDVGERLKEVDLGITEYVGDTEGFTGTIKERYSDFAVHEINMKGEVAKLTDQRIPEDPEDSIDIEDLKKKIPQDVWEKVAKIAECSDVEIDVTDMDREQRKCIHQLVKKMTRVYSETKDVGDKKLMVFTKEYSKNTRDNRKDWSARGGDYCHFILYKSNMDTMDALNQISGSLGLKSNIFSYAGTKDRRAITTQWISVKKMNPQKILRAAKNIRGAFVGNFKFEKESLKLGKLYGNKFTIALRNVTASNDVIDKGMISLRDKGFINYYGLQRFGAIAAIPTYAIGRALLQGNWAEAVDLILKPREGEQDLQLAEAREVYSKTKDARQAHDKIGRTDKIEAKLLQGLNIRGQTNFHGALDEIPRNTLLMYIHAYQSKVWNDIVTRRIKEFGLKPIVGDLVYANPEAKDEFVLVDTVHHEVEENKNDASESKATKTVETKEKKTDAPLEDSTNAGKTNTAEREKMDEKIEDDKSSVNSDDDRPPPEVKILTEQDLSNYTVFDIVMPQPGWKVVYPPYAKSWFDEQLQKDCLTPELKQKNKKYSLGGSYRKILEVPKYLSWKIIRYKDQRADLILSDMDELRDMEPIKDEPEGQFKALIVEMSLKSSTYATMALREVLKCDTSSQTHAAQSAAFYKAHEKQEDKNKEPNQQTQQSTDTSEAESIPHVENLQLNDGSSDQPNQPEDETSDNKSNSSTKTLLVDSEEEACRILESNNTAMKNSCEDSSGEDELAKSVLVEPNPMGNSTIDEKSANTSVLAEPQKHETDPTNDSGIDANVSIQT
ncbi:pseudouridylate synthase 7 homolog [Copidosoma floridanum]|uniref:pseudouridylate synthase 7 homolog n=1 Tax=Copidosoma floridanum TaxID=29053 RepID=UPI0006C9836D|nr:pseudouridylate synthase 7 homolog [Copidosoma floridanum]